MQPPRAAPTYRAGDVLAGKYRIERVLGEGAMGVVVAARHIDLHELRAIKLMLPAALGNADGVERFLREARAAVRLRSTHVARVLDVGRLDDGIPFIVMEHLEGADLRVVLESSGTLPVPDAVRYLRQACEALAEAHRAGIVHRDLKPANLFLAREPDGTLGIKVLDFGIAKLSSPTSEPGAGEMTKTTDILGTPMYMSPEQMRSTHDVDARADVWALGVILYRALAGKAPFRGETITQVCAAVIGDIPSPPSLMRPDLPPGLEAVVLRCLEKDPARRYTNAAELGAALAPFADADSLPLAPPRAMAPSFPIEMPLAPSPSGQTTGRAGAWQQPSPVPSTPLSAGAILLGAGGVAFVLVIAAAGLFALFHGRPEPVVVAASTTSAPTTPISTTPLLEAPASALPMAASAPVPLASASAGSTASAPASKPAAPPKALPRSPSRNAYDGRK